jgi:hypothetical protein
VGAGVKGQAKKSRSRINTGAYVRALRQQRQQV